jgi:NitT/TauT family transport system substrate-binding protein
MGVAGAFGWTPVIGTYRTKAGSAAAQRLRCCALVILACIFSSSCTPRTSHAPPLTIKMGTFLWPGSYWVEVAWQKGWFRDAGLNVERVNVDYKYFSALDDVVAGRLDAIGFSQFDLVRHVAAGHDLVGVAALDYSEGAEALVAHAGAHHLRDLKGKRLSLHRGTYLEFLLAIVAEREGFNLADLTLVDQPGETALEDFKAGRVDAILVWEPYVTEALATGGVSLFSAADFPGLTYSVLSLRHEFVQMHPQEVAALVRVWHQGETFIRDHPHEACGIVGQLLGYSVEEVEALMKTVRIVDLADNGRAFSYAAGFESLHGSWRRMNDYMLERGLAAHRVESSEHLDSGFIRRLE